ncbi:ATP-dependent DNA ligase [Sphingomonas sp. UYP23]
MTDNAHALAETEPMEAKLVDKLPTEVGWQFEPKWDGFRAVASRLRGHVELRSKSGKSLARYFPEIVAALEATPTDDYVLDGELILPIEGVLSFDALQARLHPAESRIRRLSRETPAQLMLFDCIALDGSPMIERLLDERRAALERFHRANGNALLLLSPRAPNLAGAQAWLAASGGALDGVIAKSLDQAYRPGERAMLKVKRHRTADCVVGGFRREKGGPLVASLLLGLYDDAGLLNHVGFTSALAKQDRAQLTGRLEGLISPHGFTGKAPGGPSRWNDGKESEWFPLKPELVVEVSFDQVTNDRFRHGTGLVRWRPDKAPRQCRMEQLDYALRPSDLADIS